MMPREPEETKIEEIDELKQTLNEEKEKSENLLASWQRAQADFVNYKQRSQREKDDIRRSTNSTLILSLLPVLDDLERAFAAIPAELAEPGWAEGVRLIEHKLRAFLEAQGLSSIEAMGEPFDPTLHEAAMHGKGQEGIVVAELQKGYRLHERVLRPTRVIVGDGEAAEPASQENNSLV